MEEIEEEGEVEDRDEKHASRNNMACAAGFNPPDESEEENENKVQVPAGAFNTGKKGEDEDSKHRLSCVKKGGDCRFYLPKSLNGDSYEEEEGADEKDEDEAGEDDTGKEEEQVEESGKQHKLQIFSKLKKGYTFGFGSSNASKVLIMVAQKFGSGNGRGTITQPIHHNLKGMSYALVFLED